MQVVKKIQKGLLGVGLVTVCLVAWALVFGLMFITTPESIGPVGVTLWFLLVFVALATLIMVVALGMPRKKVSDIAKPKLINAIRAALVPAGALTVLLGMSSLGSLGLVDVLLVLSVAGIIELYLYTSGRRTA